MTTPPAHDPEPSGATDEPVSLDKGAAAAEAPFDPYRFGHPDVPPPPEYAPPGYVPPADAAPREQDQWSGYGRPPAGPSPYGQAPYGPPPAGSSPAAPSPYGPPSSGPSTYGQAPYGQGPYGPAPQNQQPNGPHGPYPSYPYGPYAQQVGYPPQSRSNGKAVAALVLGIVSVVLFWTTLLDVVIIVLALVFGFLGLSQAKSHGTGRGQALAGLICAGVAAVLVVVLLVIAAHLSDKCSGIDHDSGAYSHCLRENL